MVFITQGRWGNIPTRVERAAYHENTMGTQIHNGHEYEQGPCSLPSDGKCLPNTSTYGRRAHRMGKPECWNARDGVVR